MQNGVSDKERQMQGVDLPWPNPNRPMFFHISTGNEEMVCMNVCMYVCHIFMQEDNICVYSVLLCKQLYVCMYVCMYDTLYVYVYMYVCMYVCMYVICSGCRRNFVSESHGSGGG